MKIFHPNFIGMEIYTKDTIQLSSETAQFQTSQWYLEL